MSVNRFQPHVLLLPEDDANRQLAVGFMLDSRLDPRRAQLLPNAGGWSAAQGVLQQDLVDQLRRWDQRYVVLLVDFDMRLSRARDILGGVPPDLRARVAVLGVWSEAERLRQGSSLSLERWGMDLAAACAEERLDVWQHELLRHNVAELDRMAVVLRSILFSDMG